MYVRTYVGLEDYIGGMKTITIPIDATMQSFTMNITDDNIVECPESFNVAIVSVTGNGVTTGNVDNVEVTILDDDGKWIRIYKLWTLLTSACMHKNFSIS